MWLLVPKLGRRTWHPFTVCTAPGKTFSVCVRDTGGAWTHGLYEYVAAVGTAADIYVDGPYGVRPDFGGHKRLVFVAGGVGVTPIAALIESILDAEEQHDVDNVAAPQCRLDDDDDDDDVDGARQQRTEITLVWTARDSTGLFRCFAGLLEKMAASGRCRVVLCVTSSPAPATAALGLADALLPPGDVNVDVEDGQARVAGHAVLSGRPDVVRIVKAATRGAGKSCCVFACGTAGLMAAAKAAAAQSRAHFVANPPFEF